MIELSGTRGPVIPFHHVLKTNNSKSPALNPTENLTSKAAPLLNHFFLHFDICLLTAEKSLKTELLLQGFRVSGDEICEQAFEHSYFHKKGWILDKEDVDTKSTTPRVISVIVTQHHVSFSRPTKTCKASSAGQTFPVFISAADKFDRKKNFAFFVFIGDVEKSQAIAYLVKN